MTSTQNEAAPESRIGYNNNNLYLPSGYLGTGNRLLNFASESVNDKSTESSTGLGTDDLGAGQNLGYLDYCLNDNAGGLTGLGLRRRLALQRALRRRNGAALGAGGGAGAAAVIQVRVCSPALLRPSVRITHYHGCDCIAFDARAQ